MKKLWSVLIATCLLLCLLASCGGQTTLDKLHTIKKGWTMEQVIDLLGKPDRYGERSVVAEIFYTVDKNTEATIAFWSSGIEITVYNSETGERAVILEGPIA